MKSINDNGKNTDMAFFKFILIVHKNFFRNKYNSPNKHRKRIRLRSNTRLRKLYL